MSKPYIVVAVSYFMCCRLWCVACSALNTTVMQFRRRVLSTVWLSTQALATVEPPHDMPRVCLACYMGAILDWLKDLGMYLMMYSKIIQLCVCLPKLSNFCLSVLNGLTTIVTTKLMSRWNQKGASENLPRRWRLHNWELKGPPTAWKKGRGYWYFHLLLQLPTSTLSLELPSRAVTSTGHCSEETNREWNKQRSLLWFRSCKQGNLKPFLVLQFFATLLMPLPG